MTFSLSLGAVCSNSTYVHVGTEGPINMNSMAYRVSAKPVINSVCDEKIRGAYVSFTLQNCVLMLNQTLAYFADSTKQISVISELRDESLDLTKIRSIPTEQDRKIFFNQDTIIWCLITRNISG